MPRGLYNISPTLDAGRPYTEKPAGLAEPLDPIERTASGEAARLDDTGTVPREGDMGDATDARETLDRARDGADAENVPKVLCGYALGCRAEAEWVTGISPRCSLHRALLDVDPARDRIVAMHPSLAWRPIARAVATMLVPVLLFLLPGCDSAPPDSALLAGAGFALGVLVLSVLAWRAGRVR